MKRTCEQSEDFAFRQNGTCHVLSISQTVLRELGIDLSNARRDRETENREWRVTGEERRVNK